MCFRDWSDKIRILKADILIRIIWFYFKVTWNYLWISQINVFSNKTAWKNIKSKHIV